MKPKFTASLIVCLSALVLLTGCGALRDGEAIDRLNTDLDGLMHDNSWFCDVSTVLSDGKSVGPAPTFSKIWYEEKDGVCRWYNRTQTLNNTTNMAIVYETCYDGSQLWKKSTAKVGDWEKSDDGALTPFGAGKPYESMMNDPTAVEAARWEDDKAALTIRDSYFDKMRDARLEALSAIAAEDETAQQQKDYVLAEMKNTSTSDVSIRWDFSEKGTALCEYTQRVSRPVMSVNSKGEPQVLSMQNLSETTQQSFLFEKDAVSAFLDKVLPR